MDKRAERRPASVHIYDTSGTGWAADDYGDPEEYLQRVATMNEERSKAGLPCVTPLEAMPDPIPDGALGHDLNAMEDDIEAGNAVYLVDLSQPGAASAAFHADLDFDGMLAEMPHGQVVQLIETGGQAVWTATTVAEVSKLQSSIDWLILALSSSGLETPTLRDAHTIDATWPPAVTRRALDGIAAGHAVWTVSLDDPHAFELARLSALPGFISTDGKTWGLASWLTAEEMYTAVMAGIAKQEQRSSMFQVGEFPTGGPIFLMMDEGAAGGATVSPEHADAHDLLRRLMLEGRETGVNIPEADVARRPRLVKLPVDPYAEAPWLLPRGGGKTDMTQFLLDHIAGQEAAAVEGITAAEAADRFSMFAWTDRDGCLHTGNFRDLATDVERRDREYHAAVANVYVMTATAELVPVGWGIETGASDRQYVVVTLPDGRRLHRDVRIGERHRSR